MNLSTSYLVGAGFNGAAFSVNTPLVVPGFRGEPAVGKLVSDPISTNPAGYDRFLEFCHTSDFEKIGFYWGTADIVRGKNESGGNTVTLKAFPITRNQLPESHAEDCGVEFVMENFLRYGVERGLGATLSFRSSGEKAFQVQQRALLPIIVMTGKKGTTVRASANGVGQIIIEAGISLVENLVSRLQDSEDPRGIDIHNSILSNQTGKSRVTPLTALLIGSFIFQESLSSGGLTPIPFVGVGPGTGPEPYIRRQDNSILSEDLNFKANSDSHADGTFGALLPPTKFSLDDPDVIKNRVEILANTAEANIPGTGFSAPLFSAYYLPEGYVSDLSGAKVPEPMIGISQRVMFNRVGNGPFSTIVADLLYGAKELRDIFPLRG